MPEGSKAKCGNLEDSRRFIFETSKEISVYNRSTFI
jgi:hypothetical protein